MPGPHAAHLRYRGARPGVGTLQGVSLAGRGRAGEAARRRPRRRVSVRLLTYGLVATLAGLLVLTSVVLAVSQVALSSAEGQLRTHLLPAQTAALSLEAAYVDEETAQRGFLLTGEVRFLEPFVQGQLSAATLERRLHGLLGGDRAALATLARVSAAHASWLSVAASQIRARRAGPLDGPTLTAMAEGAKQRFDALRHQLTALSDRTSALANAELDRIAAARDDANLFTAVAVGLGLVVALLSVPVSRRQLTRPLRQLLARVQRVAGGDYDTCIPEEGPAELATIAGAVERMRASLLENTAELVGARHQLTLHDERERIAADLHDLTIQRVFALGLSLSAAARRDPASAAALEQLVEETDRIIRELRGIIFDVSYHRAASVRAGVAELVRESARALGFVPVVTFRGPTDDLAPDVVDAVLAVLHEALSNVARHARATRCDVTLATSPNAVVLAVADDGRGVDPTRPPGDGTRNMQLRAARLGGTVSLRGGNPGGTTLEWRVPRAPVEGRALAERSSGDEEP